MASAGRQPHAKKRGTGAQLCGLSPVSSPWGQTAGQRLLLVGFPFDPELTCRGFLGLVCFFPYVLIVSLLEIGDTEPHANHEGLHAHILTKKAALASKHRKRQALSRSAREISREITFKNAGSGIG